MASILFVLAIVWGIALVWFWRQEQAGRVTPGRHRDLLAGTFLGLLVLGFFWRTVTGEVYQPADGGDLVSFLFPTYRFAAGQIHQGRLPLWNPYLYGGSPFISDIQAGLFYPPNLFLFLLWPDFPYPALQWLALAHLFWAGLGMYVLVRSVDLGPTRLSRLAALFAALAFALSDPFLIHLGNLNLIAVLSWLPWVLAAFQAALRRRDLRWAMVAAGLFAVANYAGHIQSSYYIALALLLYAAIWAGWEWWGAEDTPGPHKGGRGWFPLACLAGTGVVTGLLTAPILLPGLELSRYTERSLFTYQDTVAFSLAPTQLIGLITPGFFGRGPALHWSLWDRVELPYLGVAALLTVVAGYCLAAPRVRRRLMPWLVMALFGLVTALGIYAILHGWLTLLLPGFGQFRAPARALILWSLGGAVLAAVGLDAVRTWPDRPRDDLAAGEAAGLLDGVLRGGALILLGILLPLSYLALLLTQENETVFLRASVAGLALVWAGIFWGGTWFLMGARRRGWISGPAFALAMVGLLFFDLAATGAYTDISPQDPTVGFQHPEIVDFLRQDEGLFRIDTRTDIADRWQPDAAALHGLQDVGGVANPLVLRHWTLLWESLGGRHTRLYDMLNVKYVLARADTPLPEGKFEPVFTAPRDLILYRNRHFLPRAWLVHRAVVVPEEALGRSMLQQPDFDPTQTVLLHDKGAPALDASPGGAEQVTVTAYGPNEIWLSVQATAPAYLLLSEVWYPGWQATVNGEPATIYRANLALRAVAVPVGESTVVLRFVPATWRWGIALFGLGLVLLVAGSLPWMRPGGDDPLLQGESVID